MVPASTATTVTWSRTWASCHPVPDGPANGSVKAQRFWWVIRFKFRVIDLPHYFPRLPLCHHRILVPVVSHY